MKLSAHNVLVGVIVYSLMSASWPVICATPISQRMDRREEWTLSISAGIPCWIALHSGVDVRPLEHRRLILYVEIHNFSVEKLERVFRVLAAEFPQPENLSIRAYSDQAIVRIATYDYLNPRCYRADSPALQKMQKELEAKYNYDGTPYRAAAYYRTVEKEEYYFNSNPFKQASSNITVDRRAPKVSAEGDIDAELLRAAREGVKTRLVSALNKGANVNTTDNSGSTAMMNAAERGRINVVRILLERGADVNVPDRSGGTALMRAARTGHIRVVRELLMARPIDVNVRDRSMGMTALMFSIDHPQITKLLLEGGADINARDLLGHSALMLAAGSGNARTVSVLLGKGADVTARNKEGKTALTYARTFLKHEGRDEIVRSLEKAGALE